MFVFHGAGVLHACVGTGSPVPDSRARACMFYDMHVLGELLCSAAPVTKSLARSLILLILWRNHL